MIAAELHQYLRRIRCERTNRRSCDLLKLIAMQGGRPIETGPVSRENARVRMESILRRQAVLRARIAIEVRS